MLQSMYHSGEPCCHCILVDVAVSYRRLPVHYIHSFLIGERVITITKLIYFVPVYYGVWCSEGLSTPCFTPWVYSINSVVEEACEKWGTEVLSS